jgi:hypothetical protein
MYDVYILTTECIYVFCTYLRTDSEYFIIQNKKKKKKKRLPTPESFGGGGGEGEKEQVHHFVKRYPGFA